MTAAPYHQPRRPHLAGWLPFIRHYFEMVLAMAIGMVALHPLAMFAFQAVGAAQLLDHFPAARQGGGADRALIYPRPRAGSPWVRQAARRTRGRFRPGRGRRHQNRSWRP